MPNRDEYDDTYLPRVFQHFEASPSHLRVGAFEPRSIVAGPGERAVVWVTGCHRRCPGCMKPEWFDFDAGTSRSVQDIITGVLEVHSAKSLRGVTFSGGEPFEQAQALALVAAAVREAGLDVLVYSGYRIEAIVSEQRFAPLLAQVDWLIDGEYRRELDGPLIWRGSSNQKIYMRRNDATWELVRPGDDGRPRREILLSLSSEALRISGFPNMAMQQALRRRLEQRGITMEPAQ